MADPLIEVTPEMAQAGVIALEWHSGSFPDVQLVEAIYAAMHAVAPACPSVEKGEYPMDDKEMRLECLRLATREQSCPNTALRNAEELWKFVSDTRPNTPDPK